MNKKVLIRGKPTSLTNFRSPDSIICFKKAKRKLFPWQRSPCNEPPVWRSPTRLDLPPEHLFVVSVWMSQIYQMVCWRARESRLYWLLSHIVTFFTHRILWNVDKPLEIHPTGFVSFQFFSTARCSSSRNSLRGITHSITHSHILVAVLPPALMVFLA